MKYLYKEFNIRTMHLLELELLDPWSPNRLRKISTNKLVNVALLQRGAPVEAVPRVGRRVGGEGEGGGEGRLV